MSKLSKKTKKIIKKSPTDLAWAGVPAVALAVWLILNKIVLQKNMKLAVLGREEAGKTSFYNFLKDGDPGNPDQTPLSDKNIEKFQVQDSEGYTFSISIIDISGQKEAVASYYKDLVTDYDVILFFFNSEYFMTDEDYSTDVVDRIKVMGDQINTTKDSNNKSVYIVPTFKDKAEASGIKDIDLQKELFHKFDEKAPEGKRYANNILPMYQTNDIRSLTDLRDRIFNSYKQKQPKWKRILSSIFRELQ